jgi:hypothetical protein
MVEPTYQNDEQLVEGTHVFLSFALIPLSVGDSFDGAAPRQESA